MMAKKERARSFWACPYQRSYYSSSLAATGAPTFLDFPFISGTPNPRMRIRLRNGVRSDDMVLCRI